MDALKRQTIEETPSFSVQSLKGLMDHESLSLSVGGYIVPFSIQTYGNRFTVQPEGTGDPQTVFIEHTAVGYGIRAWFCCPFCKKRCGKLYIITGVFGCRDCHRLTYTTCQLSGNRLAEMNWKVRGLQQRLGMYITPDVSSPDYVGINETPTFKPYRMKQDTWWQLRTELEIVQLHRLQAWLDIAR